MRRWRGQLVLGALAALPACVAPASGRPGPRDVVRSSPERDVTEGAGAVLADTPVARPSAPPPARAGWHWVEGYWHFTGVTWAWVDGRLEPDHPAWSRR